MMSSSNYVFPAWFRQLGRKVETLPWVILAVFYFRIKGVKVGKGLRLWSLPICRLRGNGQIVVGDFCTVNNKLRENPAGVVHRTVMYVGNNSSLKIGDNVGISGAILHAEAPITIGNKCLLGANCSIFTSDFHSLDPLSRLDVSAVKTAPVILEENVWVGANATILKGVVIGKNSVIGAGSIVTKNIPSGVIAAGNPAVIIRALS